MNEDKPVLKHLFTFEGVRVYQRAEFLFGFSYFWQYEDKESVYGPFSTMADCSQHFEIALFSSGRTKTLVKNNVILVDFSQKKRVL